MFIIIRANNKNQLSPSKYKIPIIHNTYIQSFMNNLSLSLLYMYAHAWYTLCVNIISNINVALLLDIFQYLKYFCVSVRSVIFSAHTTC